MMGDVQKFKRASPTWWRRFIEVLGFLKRRGYFTNKILNDLEVDAMVDRRFAGRYQNTSEKWQKARKDLVDQLMIAGLYDTKVHTIAALEFQAAYEYPLPRPAEFHYRDVELERARSLAIRNRNRREAELIAKARKDGTLLEGPQATKLSHYDIEVFQSFRVPLYGEVARRRKAWRAKLIEVGKEYFVFQKIYNLKNIEPTP